MDRFPWPRALTIAGSDSGAGAGIQADLKTFSALGVYGQTVITALTAQNTTGVQAVHAIPPEFVRAQLDSAFGDIGADAVKIGMLADAAIIAAVGEALAARRPPWIILDPVMSAKSGDKLLEDGAIDALKRFLFPLADLLTPNLPEASLILGRPVTRRADMPGAASALMETGARAVLLKGGHLRENSSADLLMWREADGVRELWLETPHLPSRNTHGTGCTLSSAIAAFLARGQGLESAVRSAKVFVSRALLESQDLHLGAGHGPLHHFHAFWGPADRRERT